MLAGAVGIEPTQTVLETAVLPLYDAPTPDSAHALPLLYQTPRGARGILLGFFVRSLFAAVLAILLNLKARLSILFILGCIVIDIAALSAFKLNTMIL